MSVPPLGPIIVTTLRLALREIRHNLLRSSLTALGIIIGVAAVIIIVTLGGGATARVTADIASLGRNLLIVTPGMTRGMQGPPAQSEPFELGDADAIEREITGLLGVAPTVTRPGVAVFGNNSWRTTVSGTSNGYVAIREWPLASGRVFTEGEERSGRAVCVLGLTVRTELFGAQDPMGARIRVGNVPCIVVGVLTAKGRSTVGQDQDDIIVMPLRAVQRRIAGNRDVNLIMASVADASQTDRVRQDIEVLLRERRRIGSGVEDDFEVNDLKEIAAIVESTTSILTALLGAIAAVSLLVGGIGIMNIMLVSVTERTREIGIRLAIGALERDVLLQFLIEAMLLSVLGGLFGVVFGLVGAAIVAEVLNLPFVLNVTMIVVALVFSAGVGIVFGFFPARRAARLDPIECLRYE